MTTDPRPLVGLMGKKRAGKDTFAARLVEAHGYTRVAFADPLKEAALGLDPLVKIEVDEAGLFRDADGYLGYLAPMTSRLGDFTPRLSEVVEALGWEKAKEVREVRRTLQNYGVAIRGIEPDFWLDVALRRAEATPGPVVITDVRFPNEAEGILGRGGVLVRISRPSTETPDPHPSETALDDFPANYEVVNESTLDDLRQAADFLVLPQHFLTGASQPPLD